MSCARFFRVIGMQGNPVLLGSVPNVQTMLEILQAREAARLIVTTTVKPKAAIAQVEGSGTEETVR